jgi:hypothetical protein
MVSESMCCARFLRAACMVLILAGPALADARNCPTIQDQTVAVVAGVPAPIRLNVTNADDSTLSVFQYPLGGILEPAGTSGLDWTFIPGEAFQGSTTFTYRLTPPVGCGNGAMLGRVTLVGGPAQSTATGLADPVTGLSDAEEDDFDPLEVLAVLAILREAGLTGSGLCGLGAIPFFTFTGLFLIGARTLRRRG